MFEQEYKKMFRDVKPSAELEAETLGLLLELRDHPPAPPAPKRNLKPIFITTAASIAAAFLLTLIGVGFYHGVVKKDANYIDFGGESVLDENLFDRNGTTEDVEDSDQDQSPADNFIQNESEEKENDKSSGASEDMDDGDDGAPNSSQELLGESQEEVPSDPAEENSNQDETAEDSIVESYEELYKGDSVENVAELSEPKKINTGGIRTYLSIKEFADALEKRSTLGYGNRYYNARELLIVPAKLPECTFRQLYLDTKTGAYSYQYAIPGNELYYLTVENKSARATSLQQLKEQISYLEGEEVTVSRDGNTATYTFGMETVTATLTVAATGSSEIAPETVEQVFNAFDLTRSTLVIN